MEAGTGQAGVRLHRLHLRDVRAFAEAELDPSPEGTTVIAGPNGAGKTTFLEAVTFLGTQRSFRTADRAAMVRVGSDRAVVRAELERDGLPLLVEAELPVTGRVRTLVNRQAARDRRELAQTVPVTVFSPDDLAVVRGAPAYRRQLLDDALRLVDRRAAAALDDVDRALRQRGALLRQAGGRLSGEVAASLDVWDERLAIAGEVLAVARRELAASLGPAAKASYQALVSGRDAADVAASPGPSPGSGPTGSVAGAAVPGLSVTYRPSWSGELAAALAAARAADVRRAVTTVGPHRDDLELRLEGRDARTQASQGEQRSLGLALRLAVHELATDRFGSPPILLLDDVFSELDPGRSRALVRLLPAGQALLTTAVPVPEGVPVAAFVDVGQLGRR